MRQRISLLVAASFAPLPFEAKSQFSNKKKSKKKLNKTIDRREVIHSLSCRHAVTQLIKSRIIDTMYGDQIWMKCSPLDIFSACASCQRHYYCCIFALCFFFLQFRDEHLCLFNTNTKSGWVCRRRPLRSHHWCLSDKPFQSGSVRTIRSISFFHSIPSEMTLCHSLQTSSAEHSERASRKDRMFSAMWSRPWAERKAEE